VLTADLLRATAAVPGFRRALRLYLLETSAPLRAEQEHHLAKFGPIWVSRLDDLPEQPMLVIANEFLDALPIRQFVRRGDGWLERMVTLDHEDRFVFVEGPPGAIARALVPPVLRDSTQEGDVVEISTAALAVAAGVGARLSRQTGAALFIDYGYFPSSPGATLRALRRHRAVCALTAPGTADLSAHVDFAAFAHAARVGGAETHGPVPQARLLAALGARERAAALRARATPDQRQTLDSGLGRLLDPDGMGSLFKAVALVSPGLPTPPGFEADL
jgi:NADH dehydrogenase [ubiquinone] 1 alpha subcomplex assembly factor 7